MGIQQEDVEKFLEGNPAFAQQYFSKKMDPASLSKVSGLGQADFSQFQELSQVRTLALRPNARIQVGHFSSNSVLCPKFEESQILYELIKDMQENINMERVVFKILKRIGALIHADRCSLFMYRQRNGIGELAARLFNVNAEAEFDECVVPPDSEIVYPLDLGIVGHVALTKKPVNVKDVSEVRHGLDDDTSTGDK